MVEPITIRCAGVDDVPHLVRLRRLMFEAMGEQEQTALDAGDEAAAAFMHRAIPKGTFRAWVAVTPEGEVVSTGGVMIDQHVPTPRGPSGKIGYVLSVATLPAYRRRGLARRIVETILEWLTAQGIRKIALHASEPGRPLYESFGFEPTNEMRLYLDEEA